MPEMPEPIRVDAVSGGYRVAGPAIDAALGWLPEKAPVVVMVHGYRFAPGIDRHCPHRHILSLHPDPGDAKAISWPRHLGLDGRAGIALGFGWQARGVLHRVHARAAEAGHSLAALINDLPHDREVHVIAHSLGARVALAALHHVMPGRIGRMVLLAGAETRRPANAAMDTPSGRRVEVFNITSRENDLFDVLLEWLALAGTDTAIGEGLGKPRPNWLDLQMDQTATTGALARIGYPVTSARARICHWSPYLRPGLMQLYRALLTGALPMQALRTSLPMLPDPRWSRLMPAWNWGAPFYRARPER